MSKHSNTSLHLSKTTRQEFDSRARSGSFRKASLHQVGLSTAGPGLLRSMGTLPAPPRRRSCALAGGIQASPLRAAPVGDCPPGRSPWKQGFQRKGAVSLGVAAQGSCISAHCFNELAKCSLWFGCLAAAGAQRVLASSRNDYSPASHARAKKTQLRSVNSESRHRRAARSRETLTPSTSTSRQGRGGDGCCASPDDLTRAAEGPPAPLPGQAHAGPAFSGPPCSLSTGSEERRPGRKSLLR